jgi:uncharacterized protein YdcH (DUF465 family)
MHIEHHDLEHEFPEHIEAMQNLRTNDAHFASQFDEYHRLTDEVEALERADVPVNDLLIEEMKMQRVILKDELYRALVAHQG